MFSNDVDFFVVTLNAEVCRIALLEYIDPLSSHPTSINLGLMEICALFYYTYVCTR